MSNKANYSHLNNKYSKLLKKYPQEYVKFVYCLGCGENCLFTNPTFKKTENTGTPQFWKIFYSCVNKISDNSDFEENSVLKKFTKSFEERLRNKVNLLCKLKKKGIWLVDISIVAIDGKKKKIPKGEIRTKSWQYYTEQLLDSLNPQPKHIIVIGKGVKKSLEKYGHIAEDKIKVGQKRIPFTCVNQPQAHVPSKVHLRDLEEIFKICNR